jgi:alpha-glucosidase (family GH31 glycosyl hydrolase)
VARLAGCFKGMKRCLAFLLFSASLFTCSLARGITPHAAPVSPPGLSPAPESLYNPIANPGAVVVFGHARFTVLTPQLIRMEWDADGKFEDHASFVFLNRRLPVPRYQAKRVHGKLTVQTDALRLVYDPSPSGNGKFSATNLKISFQMDGKTVHWYPGLPDTGNLQGTTRTLDGAIGSKTREPIGPGLISRNGWVLVDDSHRPLFDSDNFTFARGEKSPWPWVMLRPAGDRQDWYFFGYGHHYKQALHDFVRVAGRIPLPPQFAFGIWWSRYWAYSDQELNELVKGFTENDTPLNVLVIDMDWHINWQQLKARHEVDQSGQSLGWTGYTWNHVLFPDPGAFLSHLHAMGLKVTLNLHPASGIQPWEKAYPAMARAMGIQPSSGKYVPFDPTNKHWAESYFKLVLHPLEKQGVNFWWLDWQQQPDTKLPGVNNTWWLNYLHFTDQEREGKRPLLFHRWGGLGNHRYEIGFSGDTVSVWPSLAFQPWFTATAANVGYAYWSHDIGGHMPGHVDPELYTRWIQFGAYSPILRTHTTKNPSAERRIWAYPEPYSSIMRKTFQLRMALQPYIYTEARHTYDSGVAFLHPLYYDWPEEDAAYTNKSEYVFGREMIVDPVTRPVDKDSQLAPESVWIPDGGWIETATGTHFHGPIEVKRSFSIDQVPVYVRDGAIIPMQPAMMYTGQRPVDPLILKIYPLRDHQVSTYTLYADSSKSEAYKRGICTWTKIVAAQAGDSTEVRILPVRGAYPGMIERRAYQLRLPADWPPSSVLVNGKPLAFTGLNHIQTGWSYEGNTLTTIIVTPSFSVHSPVTIEVRRPSGSLALRGELNGFAGSVDRLHAAYNDLNALYPFLWSPDSLIEAWQTGDRLTYHPETARAELAHFQNAYSQALSEVRKLATDANISDQQLAQKLMPERLYGDNTNPVHRYRRLLQRALAALRNGVPPS